MLHLTNPKLLLRLSMTCLVSIAPLGMFSNGIALGQTVSEQANLLTAALSQHNVKRAIHGSPALTAAPANDPLTTGAQEWAQKLATSGDLVHSTGNYGENLSVRYETDNVSATNVGIKATDDWYAEINNYDFKKPAFGEKTGHFTQVVWKGTTTLGCGYAVAPVTLDAVYSDGTTKPTVFNAYYTVCRYSPAGNVQGQFGTNVYPSMVGKSGG